MKKKILLTISAALLCSVMVFAQNINFADPKVKEICVEHWDTNHDGELSYEEAAAVHSLESAFENQSEITSFDEFQYFTGIKEIVFHYVFDSHSLSSWGENAFSKCTNLKSIIIPNSVTSIYGRTSYLDSKRLTWITPLGPFNGCTSLTTIYLPNSLESIGESAFQGCTALKSINIPNTVISLGRGSFSGCSSLESIIIPNSVKEMGQGAFYGCSNLNNINIPYGIKQLGETIYNKVTYNYENSFTVFLNEFLGLFEGCTSLTNIEIPNSVITIGDRCFKNCTNLQSISLSSSVEEIGFFAFAGCTNLNNVNIPENIKTLVSGTFADCSALTSITLPNSLVSISSVCWGINEGDEYIYDIVGPFEGCSKLDNVVIPNSIREIGMCAFRDCEALQNIFIPDSVKTIEDDAFSGCVSLTAINLPNSITSIKAGTFRGCTGLQNIFIPNSVKTIEDDAFSGCKSLTTINLPNSITSIYVGAFAYSGLKSIKIPNAIKDISLNSVRSEGGWWLDGPGTFEGCKDLKNVSFSGNLDQIAPFMFKDCSGLENIDFIDGVNVIGEMAFFGCTGLTTIDIPNTVETICRTAFAECSNLSAVSIPNSVIQINYGGVEEVDEEYQGSFQNCFKLNSVTVDIAEPRDIIKQTFTNRANATLYVPKGCKSKYQAADYWKEFKNIVEISPFIEFADAKVKELCVANWDTDHDGELSMAEAAAVTSLGTVFKKSQITSFDELQYFTGLTGIGKDAFNASTLTSITLPENITALEENAFLDCKSLMSISLPAKVQTIGLNALSGCTAMESITVDGQNESLCSVDGVLFSKDKTVLIQYPAALGTAYTVPEGTTTIARDAFYMSGLESILLPSTLTELVYDAFGYCRKLTELTIPEGVTTIGEYILDHCSALTTLTIPGTVTAIGQRMANYCTAITDVYTYIQEPFGINANCFHTKAYASATLHVPYGTGSAYASATGWKEFGKVVNMEDTSPAYAVLSADRKTLTFYNDGDKEGKGGTVFSTGNGDNTPEWYGQRDAVTKVVFDASFATARPKSTHSWFEGMAGLTALEGMEYLNTDAAVNMSRTFLGCTSLKRVDLGNLDITDATDISEMFSGCTALASLNLEGFDLQDGTATDNLLLNCKGLKTLKLSASMSGIAAGACQGVGTSTSPCVLFVPSEFNFGVNPTGTFQWKSGYFRTADEPVVYAKDTDFYSGQKKNVAVCLDNGEERYSSYQFDLTLPEGFTFETNAGGGIVYSLSSRYTGRVNVSTTMLEGNTCRVTAYMASSEYITGNDGAIISISVKADETLPLGSWEATITNVFVGMHNDVSVKCGDTSFHLVIGSEMLGDVNHDGYVNMSDVTSVISYILNKAPSPFYMNEADVNQDGWVNISDVTAIINIILHKVTANAPDNARQATLDQVFLQKAADGCDICLDNTAGYTACEMTLRLPEGCSLRNARMDSERSDSHHVLIGNLGDGLYRLAVYSENNSAFSDGEPPLLHLTVNGTLGDNACLSNILFIDDQHSCVAFPDVEGITTGINGVDADSDNTPTYNLQGIPTQKTARGVHVRRGGKYVIK